MKSGIVLTFFSVLMLVYTAWRSFDFIGGSLEGVDRTTAFIVAASFLVFSEIGLLLWLHIGGPGSTTDTQENVAGVLVWVDFVGIMIMGLGDMLRRNSFYEVDLSVLDPVLFLSPWLLVFCNLAGYLIYRRADADEETARAERQLKHEEARLDIEIRRAAVQGLRAESTGIAQSLSPGLVRSVKDRVTGRTARRYSKEADALAINGSESPAAVEQSNPTKARKRS